MSGDPKWPAGGQGVFLASRDESMAPRNLLPAQQIGAAPGRPTISFKSLNDRNGKLKQIISQMFLHSGQPLR